MRVLLVVSLLRLLLSTGAAEPPAWIWRERGARPSPAGERGYLRKSFTVSAPVVRATLEAACAAEMTLTLNGHAVGKSPELQQPVRQDVTAQIHAGDNLLSVTGRTTADYQGLLVRLEITLEKGATQTVQTDATWHFALDNPPGWDQPQFNDTAWTPAQVLGKLGAAPWGNVLTDRHPQATAAADLTVPAGFQVELLRSASEDEGSWVCMTIDPAGRLYISPQSAVPGSGFSQDSAWGGLWRVTLGAGKISRWEKVPVPIGGCMGMLWAFDSLYLSGQGPEGQAIYRCQDRNGDDVLDTWSLFKKVPGGNGEHGAHAIRLGPDQHLYFLHGNGTPVVDGALPSKPPTHPAEDDVLPRIKDPVATFFDKITSPYGHVLRTDERGAVWELWCTGLRNPYDFDFSPAGDLLAYDSDMEWDVGLPWYRPTRILRIVPGADYGFREGSAKIPETALDTMPPLHNIGLGSPTGVTYGTRSNWPEAYQQSFLAMDWTYGRIFCVHPQEATHEVFLQGKGLPVTDLEFGNDGALYFTTGGRGTQSGLYRVSWQGPPQPRAASRALPSPSQQESPAARCLAGIQDHRLAQPQVLGQVRQSDLSLDWLRVLEISLARQGQPVEAERAPLRELLGARFPTSDAAVNRSLAQLLAALEWPLLVAPSLRLMEAAETAWQQAGKPLPDPLQQGAQEEQIWYARVLCEVPAAHFTTAQRERYFQWFATTAPQLKGGNNFAKYLEVIRARALAHWPADVQAAAEISHQQALAAAATTSTVSPGPQRTFVKAYVREDLAGELGKLSTRRNFARGQEIFTSQLCIRCHLLRGTGGTVGPDLTGLGGRFSARDILDAIIDPSKVISEQYAASLIQTTTTSHLGLIAAETATDLTLYADPFGLTKQTILKKDITARSASPLSLMPPGLLNALTTEEILDLLAYLQSSGDAHAAAFQP